MATRLTLGGLGVLVGLWGAVLLLREGLANLVSAVVWFAGSVALHDAVLAPLTVLLTVLLVRVVPPAWRTRVTVGAVILLLLTATAVPQLGRFGARADNATLLDHDYTAGWLVMAALVLVGVLVAGPLHARLSRRRR